MDVQCRHLCSAVATFCKAGASSCFCPLAAPQFIRVFGCVRERRALRVKSVRDRVTSADRGTAVETDNTTVDMRAVGLFVGLLLGLASAELLSEARISEHPTDMSVTYGTQLEFMCIGTGIPAPAIKWFKNGEPVEDDAAFASFSMYVRSVLRLNASESANYTCQAQNQHGEKISVDTQTFFVNVTRPITVLLEEQEEKERKNVLWP
ncbi:Hypothetical predicted protein [Cloeon dipterum]|uniref:Ig-like domain-containing protein n=1 Tax=Cloeon dipterum TaxID=197152 RepID=A0A8S1DNA0_9INSE|nr:Hypothetical predicted protein [Cloeon dipterum]